jgi:hypothetical protein
MVSREGFGKLKESCKSFYISPEIFEGDEERYTTVQVQRDLMVYRARVPALFICDPLL